MHSDPTEPKPQRFRSKVVEIDAIQWTGSNRIEIARFILPRENFPLDHPLLYPGDAIFIDTLEGQMRADKGDWIIKGLKGEFYPCKPEIFAMKYEPIASPKEPDADGLSKLAVSIALEEMARQKTRQELFDEGLITENESADFEEAYDKMVRISREAWAAYRRSEGA